jgi:MEMO1 family protein
VPFDAPVNRPFSVPDSSNGSTARVDTPAAVGILIGVHTEPVFEDDYLALAAAAVEAFVRRREVMTTPQPLPSTMDRRAGAFVSLKKGSALRGCIGTFLPTRDSLAEEIIQNAVRAASADPRFAPVSPTELPELTYAVDVLSPPEPCGKADLDPENYGVIVERGGRRGLLLPDLPEVETVATQLQIARMKAGIGPDEPVTLHRFTVERHGG